MPYQLMQPAGMQSSVTGRKTNENTLTARLRAALYRRAVACAWLTVCERRTATRISPLSHWRRPSPLSWRLLSAPAR